jgi:hypothetical protein
MPGPNVTRKNNNNSSSNSNAKRLNKTFKSRWNKRTPNITRALRGNRPAQTRGLGQRNLFAKDRARADKLMVDLFQQGFEHRDRILEMAKHHYGYNDHMLHMLKGQLNRVGVYD